MDTLRGNLGEFDAPVLDDTLDEDEGVHDSPPPEIGADERRMQVRAYNYWASLLEDRNFPHVEDLNPENLPDFGPHGVLLDFSNGIEDPAITFLGAKLAGECGAEGFEINRLSDVPTRSLLSRITDHYMQILANQAPIGFEAEFVNQRGATILYRGILLPLSSDDETIDFIFGVINWKELADADEADELLLEIDQALEADAEEANEAPRLSRDDTPMADWADGPGAVTPVPSLAEDDGLPRPSFGLDEQEPYAEESTPLSAAMPDGDMALSDWLASARELAAQARTCEDRTRSALYDAIGRAHDFALAAEQAPAEFAAMVEDAGLTVQDRAPLTPLVKLVFGVDYDKTRLTEYAAAIAHAQRLELEQGMLADFLRHAEGGLKGVVKEERRLRRAESGKPAKPARKGPRQAIARKLRAIDPQPLHAVAAEGEEFALVMVRRTDDGQIVMLGEVPADSSLVEKAARKLLG